MLSDALGRKLVFHIGHHKTGSTTIQEAFATGGVTLDAGRVFYPGRMAHNYLTRHFEAFAAKGRTLQGSPGFPGLAQISDDLRRGEFDVAVLSGEEFEGADPRAVHKVLQRFMLPHVTDHAVVCYVRPHAARILSSFAENVKLGLFSGTPEDFFAKSARGGRFFYARKLVEWDRTFRGHFRLRPMIRTELSGGSVLQDFVETAFGPERPARVAPVAAANESLGLEDLLLVKLVQEQLVSRDRKLRHAMGWQIAPALAAAHRTDAKGGGATRLMLHKALAEQIRTTYRNDARELDAQFFGNRPLMQGELDRAVDEAVPSAQSHDPADHFNAATIRAVKVLSEQINLMLDHEQGAWPTFLLERRIAKLHGQAKVSQAPKAARSDVPKSPQAVGNDEDTAALDAGRTLNLGRLEALVTGLHGAGRHDVLARRLGNILTQTPIANVRLTALDMLRWLDEKSFPDDLRRVLEEFLLNLFFYDFAAEVAAAPQATGIEDLTKDPTALGAVLRRLLRNDDYVAAMTEAGIHYIRGALVPAYDGFDRARQRLQAGWPHHHHNRGAMSLRPMPVLVDWATNGRQADLPRLDFESDKSFAKDLPIVLVGMDGKYYRRYAARLAQTSQGRANLHFHVANPVEGDLLSAPHLRHSFETVPAASNAYFAMMRFLRLPELLRRYGRPVATLDADAQFIGPVQPLFDRLSGQDILLNATVSLKPARRYLAAVPWRHVTAQLLVAAPTQGAGEYLDVVNRIYAGLTPDGIPPTWWVDQAVLAQAADVCRHQARAVTIRKQWLHRDSGVRQGKL